MTTTAATAARIVTVTRRSRIGYGVNTIATDHVARSGERYLAVAPPTDPICTGTVDEILAFRRDYLRRIGPDIRRSERIFVDGAAVLDTSTALMELAMLEEGDVATVELEVSA